VNKEITSYFQATQPIRYRWYVIKRWVRELLCKHDYKLTVIDYAPMLIHAGYDEIKRAWRNKVWGNKISINVRCTKCSKTIVETKRIGYRVNWTATLSQWEGVKMTEKNGLHYYELDEHGRGIKA